MSGHVCSEDWFGSCYVCGRNMLGTIRAMITCPTCGNKHCPKATDNTLTCTNSNEPNQPGSSYQTCQCDWTGVELIDRFTRGPATINPECTVNHQEEP